MRHCSECGAEYTDARLFCCRCGASVGRPCDRCGSVIAEGDRFCGRCGESAIPASAGAGSRQQAPAASSSDLLGDLERDRERFAKLGPKLGQQEITRIFNMSDEEGSHG